MNQPLTNELVWELNPEANIIVDSIIGKAIWLVLKELDIAVLV